MTSIRKVKMPERLGGINRSNPCLYCDSCKYKVFNEQTIKRLAAKEFQCPRCKNLLYVGQ